MRHENCNAPCHRTPIATIQHFDSVPHHWKCKVNGDHNFYSNCWTRDSRSGRNIYMFRLLLHYGRFSHKLCKTDLRTQFQNLVYGGIWGFHSNVYTLYIVMAILMRYILEFLYWRPSSILYSPSVDGSVKNNTQHKVPEDVKRVLILSNFWTTVEI